MAGLFDFKSAEDILQERMAKTEENRLQMLKDVSQGADRPEVVRLGANLGYLLGKSLFGGKSEKEQLKETREMGETTQAMEQAGVGGEGSAQFDVEGSSYGAGVLDQARAEEQIRMGLLPQEMQEAIGEERQAKQLEQAFQNVDMNDPKQTAELVRLAIASGNTEAASVAATFHKNAKVDAKEYQKLQARKGFFERVSKQYPDLASLEGTDITVSEVQKVLEARGESSSEKSGKEAAAAYAKNLGAPPEVQKAIIGDSMSVIDWMKSKEIGEEEQSAAEKKMNELIAGGVSEDSAFELVYGTTKIFTDPTTGALTKIDLVGNTPPITIASGNKEFIRINNGVTELSSSLTKADILANKPVWEQIKENIIDKGKDIPGLGFVDSKIPGFANTPEEVRNKQLVAQLQNITLKNRSGASVSSPEFERLKTELATGSFNTEREKMIAINRMYEIAQAHEKGIRAGYGADINKEFDARWNSFGGSNKTPPPSGGEGDKDANPNDIIWEGL